MVRCLINTIHNNEWEFLPVLSASGPNWSPRERMKSYWEEQAAARVMKTLALTKTFHVEEPFPWKGQSPKRKTNLMITLSETTARSFHLRIASRSCTTTPTTRLRSAWSRTSSASSIRRSDSSSAPGNHLVESTDCWHSPLNRWSWEIGKRSFCCRGKMKDRTEDRHVEFNSLWRTLANKRWNDTHSSKVPNSVVRRMPLSTSPSIGWTSRASTSRLRGAPTSTRFRPIG